MSLSGAGRVVVDASVAAKWILAEEHSDLALALLSDCKRAWVRMLAPALLPIEAASIVRTRILRGQFTIEEARKALSALILLEITISADPALSYLALDVACSYQLRSIYDSHYVALAMREGCDLWTADKKLVDIIIAQAPSVRWIGDYTPLPSIAQATEEGSDTAPAS